MMSPMLTFLAGFVNALISFGLILPIISNSIRAFVVDLTPNRRAGMTFVLFITITSSLSNKSMRS